MNTPVTEAELQAWVDGRLPPERRGAVDAHLALHPAEAARLQAYRDHDAALRALYQPLLEQPVPPTMSARLIVPVQRHGWREWLAPRAGLAWRPALRAAAMLALTVSAGAAGWLLHGAADNAAGRLADADTRAGAISLAALPRRAALAHVVYTPEVRHPVEVGADQQAHLVAWLSKRLGAQLKPPQLAAQGYALEGGRLLPGQSGPVAQFMYRDGSGARLTLYVSTEQSHNKETGFRFAQEGQVSVFYWIDGRFGYALSGNLDKAALATVANAVYAQLEPAL
ncbi:MULTISPECIES: anti-sigma factor [unclassified Duganella]|uniref:anti-sigma factor family protein n=1 Tax=unclassified Duganella TaxID=2636909 RepID=UPI000E34966F|nr:MULTISPECIES: anti-sigma factor [unclassified Duganella]RFP10061.1 anti-sigma factor [Duganella sp. BJB475]RFP25634.1 anti-sigma factor [Duganella sp. BJB476]